MLTVMVGLRRAREVVETSAAKVVDAAQNTQATMVAVAVVSVIALVVSLIAVVVSARRPRLA